MKGPGIALLLGGKGKDDEEEEAPESGGGGSVRSLIGQAFDAIKDDDAPILAERDRHQQVADRVYALNQQFTPLVTVPSGPVGLKLVKH